MLATGRVAEAILAIMQFVSIMAFSVVSLRVRNLATAPLRQVPPAQAEDPD